MILSLISPEECQGCQDVFINPYLVRCGDVYARRPDIVYSLGPNILNTHILNHTVRQRSAPFFDVVVTEPFEDESCVGFLR